MEMVHNLILKKLIEDKNLENFVSLKGIVKNIIEHSEDYNFLILRPFMRYPNVIFEAMKNYLFVITTDVGDVKNLLDLIQVLLSMDFQK